LRTLDLKACPRAIPPAGPDDPATPDACDDNIPDTLPFAFPVQARPFIWALHRPRAYVERGTIDWRHFPITRQAVWCLAARAAHLARHRNRSWRWRGARSGERAGRGGLCAACASRWRRYQTAASEVSSVAKVERGGEGEGRCRLAARCALGQDWPVDGDSAGQYQGGRAREKGRGDLFGAGEAGVKPLRVRRKRTMAMLRLEKGQKQKRVMLPVREVYPCRKSK